MKNTVFIKKITQIIILFTLSVSTLYAQTQPEACANKDWWESALCEAVQDKLDTRLGDASLHINQGDVVYKVLNPINPGTKILNQSCDTDIKVKSSYVSIALNDFGDIPINAESIFTPTLVAAGYPIDLKVYLSMNDKYFKDYTLGCKRIGSDNYTVKATQTLLADFQIGMQIVLNNLHFDQQTDEFVVNVSSNTIVEVDIENLSTSNDSFDIDISGKSVLGSLLSLSPWSVSLNNIEDYLHGDLLSILNDFVNNTIEQAYGVFHIVNFLDDGLINDTFEDMVDKRVNEYDSSKIESSIEDEINARIQQATDNGSGEVRISRSKVLGPKVATLIAINSIL